MNTKQKIVNAIHNRTQRMVELVDAEKAVDEAKKNVENATNEVVRQIKNNIGVGRPVFFGGQIYTVCEIGNGIGLTVKRSDMEILSSKD